MKTSNKILLGFFALIVLSTLTSMIFVRAHTTTEPYVEDLSEFESRDFPVTEDFDEIEIRTFADVYLTQGAENKVEVKAQGKTFEAVETLIEDGKLIMRRKSGVSHSGNAKTILYITVSNLERLYHSGTGSIESQDTLRFADWELSIDGALNAKVTTVSNNFVLKQNGVGNINLYGTTDEFYLQANGAGNIDADGLVAKNAKAVMNGVGNIDVHATEFLDFEKGGMGNFSYRGNPRIKQSVSGIGNVSSR